MEKSVEINATGSACGECCTRITDLSVKYGATSAIEKVNLHFHCGELTAIVGPNGGGKSTLLKAILGQLNYSGEIHFRPSGGNVEMPVIGYVPQHVRVARDAPLSVQDFLVLSFQKFPVWIYSSRKSKITALEALEHVTASHLKDRRIGELSGGELQRVLLARAMYPVPEILLLDEPVSGVDVKGLSLFYQTICDLRRFFDISIILVTHDLDAIAPHADRIVLLDKNVIADGTPSDILAHHALTSFLGRPYFPLRIPEDSEIHGAK